MKTTYRLEKTETDERWDKFVENSPNGTVFSISDYLNSIRENYSVYYCYKNKEIRAAVSVIENQDCTSTYLHDFVIYNGVMFGPKTKTQNRAQVHSEHFKISTFLAEELSRRYKDVRMAFAPSIIDIRAFLWHNYGTNLPKYEPDIRYTSYVDIHDFAQADKAEDIQLF